MLFSCLGCNCIPIKYPINRITLILYGSRARNEATEDSDWDLLILLDKPKIENGDYDNVLYPFAALSWDVGEQISPIIYTKNEWNKYSFTPFYKNVEQDGIVLA